MLSNYCPSFVRSRLGQLLEMLLNEIQEFLAFLTSELHDVDQLESHCVRKSTWCCVLVGGRWHLVE